MRLRSLLFVPGDRPERMEKAAALGADALILDLEDAVAAGAKVAARAAVREFVDMRSAEVTLFVRVNPLDSAFIVDDLAALADASMTGVVLPKAEGRASVAELRRRLPGNYLVLPIASETPRASRSTRWTG